MLELAFTPSTLVLLVIIAAGVALAIRRLVRRGMCDCGGHDDGGCAHCAKGCKPGEDCSAVKDMVARMDDAASEPDERPKLMAPSPLAR